MTDRTNVQAIRTRRSQEPSALVTGGASGMGEATARRLAAAGATVVIVDRDQAKGEQVAAELDGRSRQPTSPARPTSRPRSRVATAIAPLRTCIHCAGIGWAERTLNRAGDPHSLETFRKVLEINLVGTFNVLRLAAAGMSANEPDDQGERGRHRQHRVDRRVRRSDRPGRVLGVEGRRRRAHAHRGPRSRGGRHPRVHDRARTHRHSRCSAGSRPRRATRWRESVLFPKRLGVPDDFASLAMEIVRNGYLNGEVIRMDAGIRMPPK